MVNHLLREQNFPFSQDNKILSFGCQLDVFTALNKTTIWLQMNAILNLAESPYPKKPWKLNKNMEVKVTLKYLEVKVKME